MTGPLLSLVRASGGTADLCYTCVVVNRRVSGHTLDEVTTSSSVWSLTGHVRTPRGRTLPIGWSGQGDGQGLIEGPETLAGLRDTVGRLEGAERTPAGLRPVVLAGPASALVLHEAVGHLVEAPVDDPLAVARLLGVRVAAEGLNLDDDPQASGGPAHYDYDTEGTRVLCPTAVVRDGVIVGHLHSLDSARKAGVASTANGRAASAWRTVLPRVSNLVCHAGEATEEELLARVDDGLLVHQLSDGWSDGREVRARIVLGEWVRNGRPTGRFTSGGVLDERAGLLLKLTGVANNSIWSRNALCGKHEQLLFDVGTRAPSLAFSNLTFTS